MRTTNTLAALGLLLATTACGPDYYAGNGYANNGYANNGYVNTGYAEPAGWSHEDAYWQENYAYEPYYNAGFGYEEYRPAYSYGVDVYNRYPHRSWNHISDAELRTGWERSHANSHMSWEQARPAVRASYSHYASTHGTVSHPSAASHPGNPGSHPSTGSDRH